MPKNPPQDTLLQHPQLVARQAKIQTVQQWSISARLSVRHKTDAWAGQIRWYQGSVDYIIHFNAPMGQGAMQLKSNPQFGVEMKTADGHISYADSPQSLLHDFTGWQIPMSGLQYWVMGVPVKGSIDSLEFDERGQLRKLGQQQWQIDFRSYQTVDSMDLPRKIVLRKGALKIIMVVDHWDIQV